MITEEMVGLNNSTAVLLFLGLLSKFLFSPPGSERSNKNSNNNKKAIDMLHHNIYIIRMV